MKLKKFIFILGIMAFLFSSCEEDKPFDPDDLPTDPNYGTFWAQNLRNEKFYRVDAGKTPLVKGKYCDIWVQKGSNVDSQTAGKIADEFDNTIYKKLVETFSYSSIKDKDGNLLANNTIEYADYLSDNNGKLTILLLDIQDNYEPDVDESFCAGYFWAGNFFAYEDDFQSNECDMIYVDTYPGLDYMEVVYSTMAHELQHLMNFITTILDRSIITGGVLKNIFPMDTWIDEGLSSAAEWVYTGKHLDSRIRDYNEDISGLIAKGNNFFVWDNRNDEHIYAVLDDYSTVYLFFQWLRLQAGSPEIYFDIITSSNENYKAVSNSINKYKPGNGFNNWGTLLKTWMAANRINAETGIYGYMGDATLKKLDKKTVPSGTAGSLSLYPGEGVYSKATSSTMPTNTTYIQYAGLTAITLSDTVISSGDTLLTYNVNTSMKGPKIPGTVGASANVDINIEDLPRSARRGPFPIGAGDILSRNGFKREFPSGFNGLPKGAFIRD